MSSSMDGGSAGRQECKLGKGHGRRWEGARGPRAAGRMQRQRPSSRCGTGRADGGGNGATIKRFYAASPSRQIGITLSIRRKDVETCVGDCVRDD